MHLQQNILEHNINHPRFCRTVLVCIHDVPHVNVSCNSMIAIKCLIYLYFQVIFTVLRPQQHIAWSVCLCVVSSTNRDAVCLGRVCPRNHV